MADPKRNLLSRLLFWLTMLLWLATIAVFIWWAVVAVPPGQDSGLEITQLLDRGVVVGVEQINPLGGATAFCAVMPIFAVVVAMLVSCNCFCGDPRTGRPESFNRPGFWNTYGKLLIGSTFANLQLFIMIAVNNVGFGEHDRRIVDSIWQSSSRLVLGSTSVELNCGPDRLPGMTIAPGNATGGPYTYLYNPDRRLTLVGTCLDRGAVLNELSDVHEMAVTLTAAVSLLIFASLVTGFLSAWLYRKAPETGSADQPVPLTRGAKCRRWWRVTCLGRTR